MNNFKITEENISYFINALKSLKNTKTLLVGDIMLDEYLWGDVERISQEAPVPIVKINKKTYRLGGASNVANNISSLEGYVLTCGIIGNDSNGDLLLEIMKENGIPTDGIIRSDKRTSTKKTRIIARNQQIVRCDEECTDLIHDDELSRLWTIIEKNIDKMDAVLIEDYGKGVLSTELLSKLLNLAKSKKKIITIDPKVENIKLYQGVTMITPNHHELAISLGIRIKKFEEIKDAGYKLLKELNCDSVLVTCGERGMVLIEHDNISHIDTVAEDVYDVTGAGDTVIAVITMGLATHIKPIEAAIISNQAAGLVIKEVGAATVTYDELKNALIKNIKS
jgi:D-glycero-beta-D-manno-heptose-7-phosphate kinase